MIDGGALLLFMVGLIIGAFFGWFGGMKYVLGNLDEAVKLRDEMREDNA